MRDRLTKAQVEALIEAIDGSFDDVVAALRDAVEALHDTRDLDAVLRSRGRHHDADRLAGGDEDTAWALATELNERRHL